MFIDIFNNNSNSECSIYGYFLQEFMIWFLFTKKLKSLMLTTNYNILHGILWKKLNMTLKPIHI